MAKSLQPHGLQHARVPYPSLSPGICSDSCLLSQWCYLTISSSAAPFSCCLQSFPASGSFPVSWLFASGDQSFGASASVLPINIQGWFPLGLTSLISLQSKGLLWSYLLSVEISFIQIYTNFPEFRRSRWWHPALVLLPGKIPWMEEPGRLQFMELRRVGLNWATSISLITFMHWRRKWQPTPVFLPGESQGRGSLVGCCLWGRTESDTTEVT